MPVQEALDTLALAAPVPVDLAPANLVLVAQTQETILPAPQVRIT
ncbi:hypothetical protein [Aliamphritea spongicola]|nr:hypothetical protein [Aliamphritea spongicola]